ncbi:MAG: integrase core domain-containing protein, partial [Acidimicrobiia bacterium]|nr:integrase core domain-containing protein [Acidimicrobiia bacterium]
FETSLRELGVELINSAPYHPQTLGKLERFHRTLKDWLADEGPPFDPEHLGELLDGFRHHYNRQRPHQGIDDDTPAERYGTEPLAPAQIRIIPGPEEITGPSYPPHSILRKVGGTGSFGYQGKLVQTGYRWAGARVRVIPVGDLIHVYYGEMLIRTLTIDPDRYYQALNGQRTKGRRESARRA